MVDEVEIESSAETQALAPLLWNEMQRHRDDIEQIERDLHTLKEKWRVIPCLRRVYVRP